MCMLSRPLKSQPLVGRERANGIGMIIGRLNSSTTTHCHSVCLRELCLVAVLSLSLSLSPTSSVL